jgi:thiol-disulfide isomerase/thioredoxin
MARKILIWIIFGSMAILLVMGFLKKESLNDYISKKMTKNENPKVTAYTEKLIDAKYNYSKNDQDYDFTLFEFGSNNCTPCKQLKPVLEEIRNSEKLKVNVVYFNTMKPENLIYMKYYGISAQPMLILLDKQGTEIFRHYGFISTNDLTAKIVELKPKPL